MPRGRARAARRLVPSVALALVLTGCTGSGMPEPTAPTTPPATTGSAARPSATAAGDVDCAAVLAGRQALDEAVREELDRLGIDLDDPRAAAVSTVVATMRGKDYYAAVVTGTTGATRTDAETVLGYYEQIAVGLGDLDIGTASAGELAEVLQRVDALTAARQDPSVVAAQERVQAHLQRACPGAAPPGS